MSERKQSDETAREVVFDGENIAEWFRFDRQVLRRANGTCGFSRTTVATYATCAFKRSVSSAP